MLAGELSKKMGLKLLAGEGGLSKNVSGVYICDLLSFVMSKAEACNIWITVQTNLNIVAVSVLTEIGCVIIPENIEVEEITLKKADEEKIPIFSSSKSAYELACELKGLI